MHEKFNRRDVMKAGGVIAIAPSVTVVAAGQAAADTASGNIELNADTTIPTGDYSVEVTIYEDLNGDGSADNILSKSIDDGVNTYEYDSLEGETGDDVEYWMDVELSGDGDDTPQVHSLEIVLPDEQTENGESGENTWSDDFEDQDADGWETDNSTLDVVNEGSTGSYSLYLRQESGHGTGAAAIWTAGPRLDLEEAFEVSVIAKHNRISGSDDDKHTRIGIRSSDPSATGTNALVNFSPPEGVTFLAIENTEVAPSASEDYATGDDFENEWVNIKITSDEGSDVIKAKIWAVTDPEPTDPQLERSFEGVSGQFALDVGGADSDDREGWIDEVTITGEEHIPAPHDDLRFDARKFVVLDESIPYGIEYNDPDDGWTDITDSVDNLFVNDTSVVQLDEGEHRINGVGRGETYIQIEHEDISSSHEISCATVTIEDLEYLPPFRRAQAVFSDRGFQAIGVATIGAAIISGFTRSGWAGVALGTIILMLAWAAGGAPAGIAISAVLFVVLAAMLRLEMQT